MQAILHTSTVGCVKVASTIHVFSTDQGPAQAAGRGLGRPRYEPQRDFSFGGAFAVPGRYRTDGGGVRAWGVGMVEG